MPFTADRRTASRCESVVDATRRTLTPLSSADCAIGARRRRRRRHARSASRSHRSRLAGRSFFVVTHPNSRRCAESGRRQAACARRSRHGCAAPLVAWALRLRLTVAVAAQMLNKGFQKDIETLVRVCLATTCVAAHASDSCCERRRQRRARRCCFRCALVLSRVLVRSDRRSAQATMPSWVSSIADSMMNAPVTVDLIGTTQGTSTTLKHIAIHVPGHRTSRSRPGTRRDVGAFVANRRRRQRRARARRHPSHARTVSAWRRLVARRHLCAVVGSLDAARRA